uniref:Endonuclease V n=1 Tax=Oryctolagus cuniculus TaxID=9986 RepID=A0A5F9DR27_RABIT
MARRVASGPEACVCGRTGPRVHATKVPGPRRHDNEEGGAYAGAAEVTFPEGRPRPSHGPEGGGAAPGRNPAALETARLRARVVDRDTEAWQRDPGFSGLRRVGGADVSFVKGDSASACASLVVLSFPELQVVYEESRMVRLTAPYVSGFLAFREAPFLVDAVQRLREKQPDLMPQVLLVDGNGVLHHQGFGVACHLGVLTDLPCIGVAKKLLQVDGLEKDAAHKEQIQLLQAGGEAFPLIGGSGTVLGMVSGRSERQRGWRQAHACTPPHTCMCTVHTHGCAHVYTCTQRERRCTPTCRHTCTCRHTRAHTRAGTRLHTCTP